MVGEHPWPEVPVTNETHANAAVVIIGAGISGMCTAIDLVKRNNCRNFIILEKSAGVGGTWHDNKYPGCCCDVWSMLYSYSFAQKSDWTRMYPGQEEILSYLVTVAQQYNLYQHVRFNTTVEDATWDEEEKKWKTRVTTASGSKEAEFNPEYTITSDFLVSAVGQLNQPKMPDIKGLDDFAGKRMHSARWDWSYDLKDKKIAVLGNGCTAAQILPEIAKVAKQVTVFQRTPNWVIPRLDAAVGPFMRGVYKYLPPVRWRVRGGMMDFREAFHDAVTDGQSANAIEIREFCNAMLDDTFGKDSEMKQKLLPKYNPGCKRVIITDDYYPALAKENVSLETRPIDHITADNVMVQDDSGSVRPSYINGYDLLVTATGFKTVDFMHPIKIVGRNGRALSDIWKDGAQAFNGTSVEDLPNFGMLYGPNTNLGHNSIILMIESQSRYINGLIKPILDARRQGKSLVIYPKMDRLVAYNEEVQKALLASSFNDPNCNSWYKNEHGKITNNYHSTVVDYQKRLSNVDFDDFEIDGNGKDLVVGTKSHVGRAREETYVGDKTLAAVSVLSVVAVAAGWMMRNSNYLRAIRTR